MTVNGVLWRFTVAYLILLFLAGWALTTLGIEGGSTANIGALIGAVMWACTAFAKKNRRYFNATEKRNVLIGMIAINLFLQYSLTVMVVGTGAIPGGQMLAILAFVGALHGLAIWFIVGSTKKMMIKQGTLAADETP